MKTNVILITVFSAFLLGHEQLSAQFVLSTASENVQIYSQWGKEKPMKKESPKILQMRIENENTRPVEVSFEINFIDELKVVETSNTQLVKIGPGKPGKPKRLKLKFKPAQYKAVDVDGVDVEIIEVKEL